MVGRAGNGTRAWLGDLDGEHELRRVSTDGGADGPVDGELGNEESVSERESSEWRRESCCGREKRRARLGFYREREEEQRSSGASWRP